MKVKSVSLTDENFDWVKDTAKRTGIPGNKLINFALDEYKVKQGNQTTVKEIIEEPKKKTLDLNSQAANLLIYIGEQIKEHGACIKTQDEISPVFDRKPSTIRRWIQDLIALGHISRYQSKHPVTGNDTYGYEILDMESYEDIRSKKKAETSV